MRPTSLGVRDRKRAAPALSKTKKNAGKMRLEKEEKTSALKAHFLLDHLAKQPPLGNEKTDVEGINRRLEETRRQLRQNSLGLKFLIGTVEGITATVEFEGYLPMSSMRLLADACGPDDEMVTACFMINQIIKTERDRLQKTAKPDGEKSGEENPKTDVLDQNKQVLIGVLRSMSSRMKPNKNAIKKLEAVEEEADLGTLILPPAEHLDSLHRAESAMERRFSKALSQLLTLQGSSITGPPR